MSKILILLQHNNGAIFKASLAALSAAREVQSRRNSTAICGVCFGEGASKAADEALEFGLESVSFSEAPLFAKYMAPAYSGALVKLVNELGCDVLIGASTSQGKDLFPRVAAQLDAGQASDIIGINSDGSLKRPMYAGDVFADVEICTPKWVITVRASGFQAASKSKSGGSKKEFSFDFDAAKYGSVVSYEISKGGRPELGDAEIVVSGGRALQSSENFEKVIFPLADALGAAVGASRAAVDSGYAPNDWQVGQTGKIVAPALYIAVGISGAIQHLAGMKDSKVIVAINKDADAPIFEVADFGLVADLFEAAPQLAEEVARAKAG